MAAKSPRARRAEVGLGDRDGDGDGTGSARRYANFLWVDKNYLLFRCGPRSYMSARFDAAQQGAPKRMAAPAAGAGNRSRAGGSARAFPQLFREGTEMRTAIA